MIRNYQKENGRDEEEKDKSLPVQAHGEMINFF